MCIEIKSLGSGISLQDGGRVGWCRFGVPPGGALDPHAMKAANALLGNQPDTAVLEIRQQGTKLTVIEDIWLALAGANSCANLKSWTAKEFRAGETLVFSENNGGLFSYLAAPGGWVADRFLGSVSFDPRSQIGSPLSNGTVLEASSRTPWFSVERVAARVLPLDERRTYFAKHSLEILPGPQFGDFSEASRQALVAQTWVVSTQSDRTGFRLEGEAVDTAPEIRSEPVMLGSFQIPNNGQPIVTMADGPTVGGYPKIGVLSNASLTAFAQCPPGTHVSLKWIDY